jgi:hypothetical protein
MPDRVRPRSRPVVGSSDHLVGALQDRLQDRLQDSTLNDPHQSSDSLSQCCQAGERLTLCLVYEN